MPRRRAMLTPFDQLGKQLVRALLEGRGTIVTDAEVPAATRHIDLWFTPDEPHVGSSDVPGLFGEILAHACTLELPATRSTLLVRLLGTDTVFRNALAELDALPADAIERRIALPILLRLRLAVSTDPAKQTSADQEFLMQTEDVVDKWWREAVQLGVQQGRQESVQQWTGSLVELYEARFGAMPDRLRTLIGSTHDAAVLRSWLLIIGTKHLDEVTAAFDRQLTS